MSFYVQPVFANFQLAPLAAETSYMAYVHMWLVHSKYTAAELIIVSGHVDVNHRLEIDEVLSLPVYYIFVIVKY